MEERLAALETRVRDLQAEVEDLKLNISYSLAMLGRGPSHLTDTYRTNRDIAKGENSGPPVHARQYTPKSVNVKGGKTRRSKRRT
jgi:hypothetical protein